MGEAGACDCVGALARGLGVRVRGDLIGAREAAEVGAVGVVEVERLPRANGAREEARRRRGIRARGAGREGARVVSMRE